MKFTPQSVGPKTCNLEIASNDPDTPVVTLVLTGNTPAPSIDVAADQSFLSEVIRGAGVCTTSKPFPISSKGACKLTITNVAIGGVNASDYSLSALPSLPIIVQPGHVAGDGALKTVFAPTAIDRDRIGTLTVTYETDPITHATTNVVRNLCGEGALTGARVLVRSGGVPVGSVNVTPDPTTSCVPFQFHREYGTVGNPIQLLPGSYQVTATALINGKRQTKTVGFDVQACDFIRR